MLYLSSALSVMYILLMYCISLLLLPPDGFVLCYIGLLVLTLWRFDDDVISPSPGEGRYSRDASVNQGLMARGSSQKDNRSEGRSKSKGKTISCFECHEKGNYKRDCPMLRKEKEHTACTAVSSSAVNYDDFDIGEVLSVNMGHGEYF